MNLPNSTKTNESNYNYKKKETPRIYLRLVATNFYNEVATKLFAQRH